jgi:sec-independent protein translocase protein TatB
MFDVGFWELCLVGLVSLLVIGPERLPKAARVAGYWVAKTRNMIASAKAEITQELHDEELRQTLKHQQQSLEEFKDLISNNSDEITSELDNHPQTKHKNDRE